MELRDSQTALTRDDVANMVSRMPSELNAGKDLSELACEQYVKDKFAINKLLVPENVMIFFDELHEVSRIMIDGTQFGSFVI